MDTAHFVHPCEKGLTGHNIQCGKCRRQTKKNKILPSLITVRKFFTDVKYLVGLKCLQGIKCLTPLECFTGLHF